MVAAGRGPDRRKPSWQVFAIAGCLALAFGCSEGGGDSLNGVDPSAHWGAGAGGAAELGCPDGFADCDGAIDNGCETNTTAAVAHCGSCDTTCPERAHATTACVAGT